jgi:hypothetical protein
MRKALLFGLNVLVLVCIAFTGIVCTSYLLQKADTDRNMETYNATECVCTCPVPATSDD